MLGYDAVISSTMIVQQPLEEKQQPKQRAKLQETLQGRCRDTCLVCDGAGCYSSIYEQASQRHGLGYVTMHR